MSYIEIQRKIRDDKNLADYDEDELDYVMKPVGTALYNCKGRPRKCEDEKARPNDRIKCDICSKYFTRSGRSGHNRTQYHMIHSKINKKLRNLLINK